MKVCCIVGAGDCTKFDFKKKSDDLMIAADGGYDHLKKLDIFPDVVIGDFDSLGYVPEDVSVVKLPTVKDVTDMYAAVETGIEKGYREFVIYGGCGGRLDHTLSNIQLAASIAQKGMKCVICDGETKITALHNNKIDFSKNEKGYISVFAHSDICEGVTIKGMKYCVDDVTFCNTFPLGVSNEFIGEESSVTVKKGTLIVIY